MQLVFNNGAKTNPSKGDLFVKSAEKVNCPYAKDDCQLVLNTICKTIKMCHQCSEKLPSYTMQH